MSSSLPFERLSVGHALLPFDCGDEDINDFFVSQAMHYQKELLAVTYFLEDGENTVFYFTLSNDKVTALELSKGFWRKIKALFPHSKHRKDYPAVKIGRLGVSKLYQKTGDMWSFKYNLEGEELSHNISVSAMDTLGRYSKISTWTKNYDSSSITVLLGDMKEYKQYSNKTS